MTASGDPVPGSATTLVYPTDDETFQSFLQFYRYDRRPLNPQVEGVVEDSAGRWRRERVTFDGLDDRIVAYLYVPHNGSPPYQTIYYGITVGPFHGAPATFEIETLLASHIQGGRALMVVVPKGAEERPWPGHAPDVLVSAPERFADVSYREEVAHHTKEYRIGLDYLETRDEFDSGKVAYLGFSWGSGPVGIILTTVDTRFAAAAFLGGGLQPLFERILPEARPINFAPRMKMPKFLLNGRFDELFPPDLTARPLYDVWPEPKRLQIEETGHLLSVEARGRVLKEWLDETLGPVDP